MVSWLDMVIPITTMLISYSGWRLGVARLGAIGLGTIAAVLVAKSYYAGIATHLSGLISYREIGEIISFVTLASSVFIGTLIVGLVARRLLRLFFLGWVDGALGCVLGIAIAGTLWFMALDFSTPHMGEGLTNAVTHSNVAQFLLSGFPQMIGFLPPSMEELLASIPARLGLVVLS